MTDASPPSASSGPGSGPRRNPACAAIRDDLLTADPAVLGGDAGSALGRHLAICPSCRRDAERIRAAHARLDAWLDRPHRRPDVQGILAEAAGRRGGDGAHGKPHRHPEQAGGPGGSHRRAGSRGPAGSGGPAGSRRRAGDRRGGGSRRGRPPGWAVAVALAAGIAGLVLLGRDRRDPGSADLPVRVTAADPLLDRSPDLDIEVPGGTDAAVFETGDPDITVIWFMGGDR